MYNRDAINRLVAYIQHFDGIGDKEKLSSMVKKEFNLVQDRKVFYSPDFAIRFSKAKSKRKNVHRTLRRAEPYRSARLGLITEEKWSVASGRSDT